LTYQIFYLEDDITPASIVVCDYIACFFYFIFSNDKLFSPLRVFIFCTFRCCHLYSAKESANVRESKFTQITQGARRPKFMAHILEKPDPLRVAEGGCVKLF